jgi:hypothetical protein
VPFFLCLHLCASSLRLPYSSFCRHVLICDVSSLLFCRQLVTWVISVLCSQSGGKFGCLRALVFSLDTFLTLRVSSYSSSSSSCLVSVIQLKFSSVVNRHLQDSSFISSCLYPSVDLRVFEPLCV